MNKRQAKKKRKKQVLKVSKTRKKQLFKFTEGSQGYKKFKVKAKDVKEKEIKWLVKTLNKRLYNIEKKGLTEASQEYRTIAHYATSEPSGKGKMYNVNYDTGTIRITSDLSRFQSREELTYFINTLRNIYQAKTSTAKGTRSSLNKAYNKFLEISGRTKQEIPFDKYGEIWRTYRNVVSEAKKEKGGSDVVMELIMNTNFYDMSMEEISETLEYINNFEDSYEALDFIVDNFVQYNNVEEK